MCILSSMQSSQSGLVPSKVDDKPHHNQLVCQQPYYHNCRLLAPDGTLLSIVSRKKLDWYLERNLGGMSLPYHSYAKLMLFTLPYVAM